MSLVEHGDCVICLTSTKITTYCKYCYTCQICNTCRVRIQGLPGINRQCPTCRSKNWQTNKKPIQIQQIIPEIVIHSQQDSAPSLSLQHRIHCHFTCNCITINIETVQIYRQICQDIWQTHGNTITCCKQLLCLIILCYLLGFIITVIIENSTDINLHGSNRWIWIPIIIGFFAFTSIACTCNLIRSILFPNFS